MNWLSRTYFVVCPLILVLLMMSGESIVAAQEFEGTLRVNLGAYHPTGSMEKSETNPYPRGKARELAAQYEEMHPGVKIEFVDIDIGSSSNSRQWQITQQLAGRIPHIVNVQAHQIQEDIGKGWWVPLDAYFAQPNPYVEGNERWLDIFLEGTTKAKEAPDGNTYVVPVDLVTVLIFYNKDIFEQVGIAPPQAHGEMLENCRKLRAAGFVPYGGYVFPTVKHYYTTLMGDMLLRSVEPMLDADSDGHISAFEVTRGIKKGIYSAQLPEYKEWMEISKEFAKTCWSSDWTTTGKDQDLIYRKFAMGEMAMAENSSLFLRQLNDNPAVDFEWGSFGFPRLSREDSSYSLEGEPRAIGGATATQWAITQTAVKDGLEELAADFLMWLSAPMNAAPMIDEYGLLIPNIKGIPGPRLLQPVLDILNEKGGEENIFIYPGRLPVESDVRLGTWHEMYFTDQLPLQEALRQIDRTLQESADLLIRQRNWTID